MFDERDLLGEIGRVVRYSDVIPSYDLTGDTLFPEKKKKKHASKGISRVVEISSDSSPEIEDSPIPANGSFVPPGINGFGRRLKHLHRRTARRIWTMLTTYLVASISKEKTTLAILYAKTSFQKETP